MARKRVKRYDDGGEIVVTGQRENQVSMDMLDRLMRSRDGGGGMPNVDGGGGGGGGRAQRFVPAPLPQPSKNVRLGKTRTPIGSLYGPNVDVSDRLSFSAGLGKGALGNEGKPLFGANARFAFKKGGKVKKMAKGGSVSSASKRADGCATKGKTKGRFV
jgi:hypothetical protein